MCFQIYMTVVTAVIAGTNTILIIKYYLCTTNNHEAVATNKSWLKFGRNYRTVIIDNQQHMKRTSVLRLSNLIIKRQQ